ncbi:MAG TPA: PmeII family type II restriction endonuclease [Agriterribacter sp.]|nr:PmeII family type II restriction endonuclease [Agriterribacter sp.]
MTPLNLQDVTQYVEQNIESFHKKRIESLDGLKLTDVLKRKNPYLFKAKYVLTAQDIIKGIVDAHISSQEETIFGNWLEGLAIFINKKVYAGLKSGTEGVDLDFEKDGNRYVVVIKSGPFWGNKGQKDNMYSIFKEARKRIGTSGNNTPVIFVNGCCYGRDSKPLKTPKKGPEYHKFCGQRFWEFISGDATLYTEIIEPLGNKAKEKNDDFIESYSKMINKFTLAFAADFCKSDGAIDWEKLVAFNSSATPPKIKRIKKVK